MFICFRIYMGREKKICNQALCHQYEYNLKSMISLANANKVHWGTAWKVQKVQESFGSIWEGNLIFKFKKKFQWKN